jgi:class 3 adenylate cyclase
VGTLSSGVIHILCLPQVVVNQACARAKAGPSQPRGRLPAAQVGDRRWRELIGRYERDLAERTRAHGGRIVQTTGDGILAVFPVPSHAMRCACALIDVSARIELQSRVGIHAGEVEFRGDAITGLSVHIAARVCALADPDEVLATRTVKDVLVGSGFDFTDRGTHTLKGVPDSWQLFSVRRP